MLLRNGKQTTKFSIPKTYAPEGLSATYTHIFTSIYGVVADPRSKREVKLLYDTTTGFIYNMDSKRIAGIKTKETEFIVENNGWAYDNDDDTFWSQFMSDGEWQSGPDGEGLEVQCRSQPLMNTYGTYLEKIQNPDITVVFELNMTHEEKDDEVTGAILSLEKAIYFYNLNKDKYENVTLEHITEQGGGWMAGDSTYLLHQHNYYE